MRNDYVHVVQVLLRSWNSIEFGLVARSRDDLSLGAPSLKLSTE